ncbi:MAG TPA: superoxide dismutase [Candidatus Limiplasma sp.]|nr:superoxide dismutase [Candidatus Limiplasma sp.]
MFTQYQLPYAFNALEPHIDALTMETHYTKHHAGYTKNLNDAAEKAGVSGKDISDLLSHLDSIEDESLRTAIRNNGGGFFNHNLYFSTLSPDGGEEPDGALAEAINKHFGDFNAFRDQLSKLAAGRFGSGWAWLSVDRDNKLVLSSSPNQDNPLMEGKGLIPIFGIDVWEHAYYLKYKNLRADYIKALFNVVSWRKVAENFDRALHANRSAA